MTVRSALIAAATLFAVATSSPAFAQAVIDDPGRCAQAYPNANCQNYGPGNPYTDRGYYRNPAKDEPRLSGLSVAQPPKETALIA
jgi:hypothetical protein